MTTQDAIRILQRIAQGIERMGPQLPPENDIKSADAYVWNAKTGELKAVADPNYTDLKLLLGIDAAKDVLVANTLQFAKGHSANNVLLWGARGMGKSSLIRAVHRHVNKQLPHSIALIEIRREDIPTLHQLVDVLRGWVIRRFIIYCDDLTFDERDTFYRSLKTPLEGGIEPRPDHILFYATSNSHHLLMHDAAEGGEKAAIHQQAEATEEKIPLLDRFGICLNFAPCSLETYLAIAESCAAQAGITMQAEDLRQQAFQWTHTRGTRSGRVAWQFVQDLAGKMGKRV